MAKPLITDLKPFPPVWWWSAVWSPNREKCTNQNRCLRRSWEIHTGITDKKCTILKQMSRRHMKRISQKYRKEKLIRRQLLAISTQSPLTTSLAIPLALQRRRGMSWWNPALFSQSPSQELNLPILLCACFGHPPPPPSIQPLLTIHHLLPLIILVVLHLHLLLPPC